MDPCWSDEQVEAAARGDAADTRHLERCPECRARLDAALGERALLEELRSTRARGSEPPLVPGYRIEGEIQRGGQGVVYRAVQETTRRPVALKLLLAGPAAGVRERRRFEREIELASRLDHPGIVRLYDSGVAAESPWCAFELVTGERLDEWVRREQPALRRKVELACELAAAVAHAHQRGVIHRDLKPANVLVDAQGHPRVLDFGAALADLDGGERLRLTAPGEFLGTLAYAAPEQLRGAQQAIDTRTDVYALGTLLYELLTGRLPYELAGGVAEIAERVTREPASPPSAHARGIDRDLDAIVGKALASDPAGRYGSAEALERDLARYLAGEAVEARRASLAYLARKYVARRKRPLAAALALALLGGAFARTWVLDRERTQRQSEQAALVRSIVRDLFAAPSPQRMGGDARLLDVYEVLARELDGALENAPDVQGEVELSIGDTYRRLLRAPEAVPHLRRACERFRGLDQGRGLESARAEGALALALADVNDPQAIEIANSALAIRERSCPPGDTRIAESRRTLAIAVLSPFRGADTERARALLESALADQRAAFGEEHPEVAHTKLLLAGVDTSLSAAAVEFLLSSALATLERTAAHDPRALQALMAYATFLQRQGRFDEARERLDRAGVLAHSLFGDALASDMLRRHARLEYARGNYANAELLSRQAVARELERWAARKPDEAAALQALARRVEQPGQPGSEPPYAEAFARLRACEGDGAFELAQWANGIALVLHALGRGSATEPLLREALTIRCRALGADCPVRRKSIELLAGELAEHQRGKEVLPLLEESLATYERVQEAGTPEAQRTRELLECCRAQAGGR